MEERSWTPDGFEWDEHNIHKIWDKHRVSCAEAEEVFFNEPLLVAEVDRSKILYTEARFAAFGQSDDGRLLTVVFTIRSRKARVISARDMSRQERRLYHEKA